MTALRSVLCHVSMTLEDGSVADNTKTSGQPMQLTIGDTTLSPAFEAQLGQINTGDKRRFTLQAADAFGMHEASAVHTVTRDKFSADIKVEPGLMVNFSRFDGEDVVGVIRSVADESVEVDFNHPLAGQTITFEVEVIREL